MINSQRVNVNVTPINYRAHLSRNASHARQTAAVDVLHAARLTLIIAISFKIDRNGSVCRRGNGINRQSRTLESYLMQEMNIAVEMFPAIAR